MKLQMNCVIVDSDPANRQELALFCPIRACRRRRSIPIRSNWLRSSLVRTRR
jgi:hypothetical protein